MGVIGVTMPDWLSLDQATASLLDLLTSVLCLSRVAGDDEPSRKRRRETFFELDVPCAVWQGRRQRRRQLQKQVEGQVHVETMVLDER